MATTPVDSGGTPSAPSPMVAVPGAREAPVILGTGIGMSMPKMECKINLRSGNQDAWRRWTVNRNDVITAHGLDALMDNQLMPTLEVIGERFPKLSSSERQEALVSSSRAVFVREHQAVLSREGQRRHLGHGCGRHPGGSTRRSYKSLTVVSNPRTNGCEPWPLDL